jgi:hypothetical protein
VKRGHLEEIETYFFAQPHVVEGIVNHVFGAAKQGVASTYNKAVLLAERRVALEQWAFHLVGLIELRVMTHHSHVPENSSEIGGKLLSGT